MPIHGKGLIMGDTSRRICHMLEKRGEMTQIALRSLLGMSEGMYYHAIRALRLNGFVDVVGPSRRSVRRTDKMLPKRIVTRRKRVVADDTPRGDWARADPVVEAAMRAMVNPPIQDFAA